jgi:hypothetical protein
MKRDEEPPLEYLLDCSKAALSRVLINHRARAANCRKDVQRSLDEWITNEAIALLSEWFETFGEKLIEMAAQSKRREVEELPDFKLTGRAMLPAVRPPQKIRKLA